MNPLGGTNNTLSTSLAKKAADDARLLAKDTSKGQVSTATTVGRAVNQTTQDLKQTTLEAPREKVTLSTPQAESKPQTEAKGQVGAGVQETARGNEANGAGAASGPESKPADSKSAEALMTFTETLLGLDDKQEVQNILTQAASVDTSKLPGGEGGQGQEVAMAATALRAAVAKLQAKMPGATAEQIREAAKTDPEIAKWAAVADSANNFLTEIKAEGGAAQAPGQAVADPGAAAAGAAGAAGAAPQGAQGAGNPMMDNPFRLNPEQQAQMFADNVKTQQAILNIYQQMWAEMSKARAQRHQLMMETANTVNQMMMESHVNRMKTSDSHRRAVMSVILENYK